jgi:hypothetical protein
MAFKGTPTVFTRPHGGSKDNAPATLGSLSAKGMIKADGLSGCNGNEAALLTGNREQKMTGNETMTRKGNIVDKTTGNETLKLTGTRKENIDTDLNQKVGGNATVTVIGDSMMTYTGHQVVNYKAELYVTEWQARWHNLQDVFHFEKVRVDSFLSYTLGAVTSVSASGFNVDLRGVNLAGIGAYADWKGIRMHDSAEDIENTALKQNFKVLNSYFYCVTNALGPAVMIEADAILHTLGLGPNIPL